MFRRLTVLAACIVACFLTGCSKSPIAIFAFPFRPGTNAAASDSLGARMAAVHDQPRHAAASDDEDQ